MADTKTSDLTAIDAVAVGDLFAVVDITATQATKQATFQQLINALGFAFGAISITSTAVTTVSTQDTPVKMAGTTTLSTLVTAEEWSMPSNNRMRYDGTPTCVTLVVASIGVTSAGNNKTYNWYIATGAGAGAASIVTETKVPRKIATGADVGAMCLFLLDDFATNDFLEVWIEGTDASPSNATLEAMNLIAISLPIPT